ncbi:hypothetical protein JKP88DRAFT_262832 [Tribonema minus]|uniref:Uncharacterized protein n=1 Tax=Tribonema minus TaxID=303371 RepID=A0A836CG71_9STRA|nr:hypothetical protein JKP88DRAFT_262832 [Tribonema minus]
MKGTKALQALLALTTVVECVALVFNPCLGTRSAIRRAASSCVTPAVRGAVTLLAAGDSTAAGGNHSKQQVSGDYETLDKQQVSSGDETLARIEREIQDVTMAIGNVSLAIGAVENELKLVEDAMMEGGQYKGVEDQAELLGEKRQLRKKEEQLRKKEEQLRKKEEQLRDEKKVLLERKVILERSSTGVQQVSSGIEPAPMEVQEFWRCLVDAREDEHGFLRLTEGTHFPGNKNQRVKAIYVRQWYKDLQEEVLSMTEPGPQHARKILITGRPGTGKSLFALYWLWLLKLAGKTVIYQANKWFYRFSGDTVWRGSERHFADMGFFDDPDCWYLSDPPAPAGTPWLDCEGITLAFMSPKKWRYNEFLKAPLATGVYMTPWTLSELQHCRQHLFPNLSVKQVRRLYIRWGGSPRYVLQYARNAFQQNKLQRSIVAATQPNRLAAVFASQGESSGDVDDVSDQVLEIVPTSFSTCTVRFTSPYVFAEIYKKEQQVLRQCVRGWLAAALGGGSIGTTPGNMLEQLAHNVLCQGGSYKYVVSKFKAVVSKGKRKRNLNLHLPPTRPNLFEHLAELTVRPGVYFWPLSKNFKAIDSFVVIDGTLYMFQITTDLTHIAGAKGVTDVVNKVRESCSLKRWVLVFVVPDDLYQKFSYRKWTYTNETAESPVTSLHSHRRTAAMAQHMAPEAATRSAARDTFLATTAVVLSHPFREEPLAIDPSIVWVIEPEDRPSSFIYISGVMGIVSSSSRHFTTRHLPSTERCGPGYVQTAASYVWFATNSTSTSRRTTATPCFFDYEYSVVILSPREGEMHIIGMTDNVTRILHDNGYPLPIADFTDVPPMDEDTLADALADHEDFMVCAGALASMPDAWLS